MRGILLLSLILLVEMTGLVIVALWHFYLTPLLNVLIAGTMITFPIIVRGRKRLI